MVVLEEQYRMHATISNWASMALYEGRLRPHSSNAKHTLQDLSEYKSKMSWPPILMIDTTGCDMSEETGKSLENGSKSNRGEADIVVHHVSALLDAGLSPSNIGIITPYNAQVTLIKELLQGLNKSDEVLEVRTVDGFQGREKEAIIISLVRSNRGRNNIGFLRERRRLNVAITRARRHCCIVCDSDTISRSDKFLANLVDYFYKKGVVEGALQFLSSDDYGKGFSLDNPELVIQKKEEGKKIDALTEEKIKALHEKVRKFAREEGKGRKERSLKFSRSLSSAERAVVHEVAESLGLDHCSHGEGVRRQITIYSKINRSNSDPLISQKDINMNDDSLISKKDVVDNNEIDDPLISFIDSPRFDFENLAEEDDKNNLTEGNNAQESPFSDNISATEGGDDSVFALKDDKMNGRYRDIQTFENCKMTMKEKQKSQEEASEKVNPEMIDEDISPPDFVPNFSLTIKGKQKFNLQCNKSHSFVTICQLIEQETGICSSEIRLIYKGKDRASDTLSLSDAGVRNGATMMMLKTRTAHVAAFQREKSLAKKNRKVIKEKKCHVKQKKESATQERKLVWFEKDKRFTSAKLRGIPLTSSERQGLNQKLKKSITNLKKQREKKKTRKEAGSVRREKKALDRAGPLALMANYFEGAHGAKEAVKKKKKQNK
eukprot:g4065.t1